MNIQNLKNLILLVSLVVLANTANAQTQIGADIDGEGFNDLSGGYSVSMPDTYTVAIGAHNNFGIAGPSGHTRIYRWNGTSWTQKGDDIDGEAAYDGFGFCVSMPDSNTVAIGAYANDGNGSNSGHVRIFRWDGTAWGQKGIDIDGETISDISGRSVSMPDSNTVAIGAPENDGTASNSGHVRIYTWNGTAWIQKGLDIDGEGANDKSGSAVSMPDANTVAIGAPHNNATTINIGHVRIYRWNGTAWIQKGIDLDGEGNSDEYGGAVSMPDANTIAIGAHRNDGGGSLSGHVRIFQWNGTAWVQQGMDIYGEAYGDNSGRSVSMPSPNTVAIGAPGNNGNLIVDVGHVRIYDWSGTTWIQRDLDIDGEAASDYSGRAVSMPNDSTVAIGAPNNDGTASNAGHVRIYNICPADSTHEVEVCGSYTWNGVTYTSSNNSATDTLTTPAGCEWIIRLNLTINNATSGTKTVTACDSYTWIDGNTYTTSNNSATYTLSNVNGCDSVVTLNLTINTVNVSVTNNAPTLIANATGATYQWIDCDNNNTAISGELNASFIPASNGNYAVAVTQNGCTDTSACEVVNNVGVLENSFGRELTVYPNPTNGELSIDLGTTYPEVTVVVKNVIGQETQQLSWRSSKHIELILEGSTGIYFVEITANDKKAILKVAKE